MIGHLTARAGMADTNSQPHKLFAAKVRKNISHTIMATMAAALF